MGGPAMGMMGGGPPMKKPPPHVMILKLFNFSLFCQCPLLLLVSVVGCLFSMLFYGSILHMMPRALSINPRSGLKAVILVSIIGISTLIGRILQGVLMKRQIGKPMKVIGVSSFISGVLGLIFPLGNFYPGLVACCFVFGVCNGLIQGFTLAFLREAVGLLNLMTARALFMIWYGIGGCLGPLIAGLAYDHSGSHMMSFCILGGCSVLGAVLCLLTPRVAMKQKQITETIQQKMQAAMRERMANAERPTPPAREDENTVVDACISSV
ncbi:monocarboxylate transporter 10-like [Ptychodera flava]|uniref:monocarboxylate transporter 10-like n=1 Tax=Ptychodera flava TaxID=63121 RepID=UPI003969FCAF